MRFLQACQCTSIHNRRSHRQRVVHLEGYGVVDLQTDPRKKSEESKGIKLKESWMVSYGNGVKGEEGVESVLSVRSVKGVEVQRGAGDGSVHLTVALVSFYGIF